MTKPISPSHVSRRGFLKVAGGAALAAAGVGLLPQVFNKTLSPASVVEAAGVIQICTSPARTAGFTCRPIHLFRLFLSGQPGASAIQHLHLRLSQRHGLERDAEKPAEDEGAAQRAVVLGRSV